MRKIRVGVIGSTGSIGTQTLQVIKAHEDLFEVTLLACKRNIKLLSEQISHFNPTQVIHGDTTMLNYSETYTSCDIVINGISGLAGLLPTIAVLESPAKLATANKESLVSYGSKIMEIASRNNKTIIPVDSEHSAIFQCLEDLSNIKKLILTASGGPFRGYTTEQLEIVTSNEAIKHPTWNMGLKVTIDSATLMNKGMELIEAKHLFGVNDIDILIHKESVVHSLVEFKDGSMKAMLSNPDMTIPIQYALTFPKRVESMAKPLDLSNLGILTFGKPDFERFPCLGLALKVLNMGDLEGTVMAVADEIAVELFFNNKIGFYDIPDIIEKCLNEFQGGVITDVSDISAIANDVKGYIESKSYMRCQ